MQKNYRKQQNNDNKQSLGMAQNVRKFIGKLLTIAKLINCVSTIYIHEYAILFRKYIIYKRTISNYCMTVSSVCV